MKLEEKGPILPPPVLRKYPQLVSDEIQSWNKIISATHWDLYDGSKVDGADFYVGAKELGHIHLDGSVHLATNVALQKALLKNALAEKFPYGEGWVLFNIRNKSDAEHAIKLFKINYDRLTGIPLQKIIDEIDSASRN